MLCFIYPQFICFFPIFCQACTGICRPEQLCTDQTCHPDTGHRVCALPAPSQPKRRPHGLAACSIALGKVCELNVLHTSSILLWILYSMVYWLQDVQYAWNSKANMEALIMFLIFCTIQDSGLYLKELIDPVLTCFNDSDSRLRYYACEALYNIVKVARGAVLPHFNVLFDGLSKVNWCPIMSGCMHERKNKEAFNRGQTAY